MPDVSVTIMAKEPIIKDLTAILINLAIIALPALLSIAPLSHLEHAQERSRKILAWIWIILGTVPLQSAIANGIIYDSKFLTEAIVYSSFAIPVIIPALFLVKTEKICRKIILAYSWLGLSVVGLFFLLFTLGAPIALFNEYRYGGGENIPSLIMTSFAGAIWTGAALFIFYASIKTLRKIKDKHAPPKTRTLNALEVKVNKIAQEKISMEEAEKWFKKSNNIKKKEILKVLKLCLHQSHPSHEEIERGIKESGLKETYTPCVLMKKKKNLNEAIFKTYSLPEKEWMKTFALWIKIFSIADKRRRETDCKNGCSHE
jgi:hypothetical protein